MFEIISKEELRENMIIVNEKQKDLLQKRDLLLKNNPQDKENALRLTHEIAKLMDFIQMAEKELKNQD